MGRSGVFLPPSAILGHSPSRRCARWCPAHRRLRELPVSRCDFKDALPPRKLFALPRPWKTPGWIEVQTSTRLLHPGCCSNCRSRPTCGAVFSRDSTTATRPRLWRSRQSQGNCSTPPRPQQRGPARRFNIAHPQPLPRTSHVSRMSVREACLKAAITFMAWTDQSAGQPPNGRSDGEISAAPRMSDPARTASNRSSTKNHRTGQLAEDFALE